VLGPLAARRGGGREGRRNDGDGGSGSEEGRERREDLGLLLRK